MAGIHYCSTREQSQSARHEPPGRVCDLAQKRVALEQAGKGSRHQDREYSNQWIAGKNDYRCREPDQRPPADPAFLFAVWKHVVDEENRGHRQQFLQRVVRRWSVRQRPHHCASRRREATDPN